MSHTTCWTMIEGARDGDEVAREEFTRRYLSVVRAYLGARWSGPRARGDLEDAVQEVFLECLREGGVLARARPGAGAGFRAFLLGVVRNVARRFESRRAARPDDPGSQAFDGDDLQASEESLTRVFDRGWAHSILREAIRRMEAEVGAEDPAERRRMELLRLRFREGIALVDIARQWEQEPATIYRMNERALSDFERSLRATVAFHHPHSPENVASECRELLSLLR